MAMSKMLIGKYSLPFWVQGSAEADLAPSKATANKPAKLSALTLNPKPSKPNSQAPRAQTRKTAKPFQTPNPKTLYKNFDIAGPDANPCPAAVDLLKLA